MNSPTSDPHTPPRRPSHADRSPGPFSSPLTPISSWSTPSTRLRNNEDPFGSIESTPTHSHRQPHPTASPTAGIPGDESISASFPENSELIVQEELQPDQVRDFERPRRSQCTTLYDLIRAGLPQPPPYTKAHKSFLSSMKQFNKTEKTMASDSETAADVLEEVVYAEGMLNRIIPIARERLSSMKLDWDSEDHVDLINAVSPWNIRRILPPCVNSEKEVEDWGVYTNISPVLLVLDCIIHNEILPAPLNTPQVIPVEAPNGTSSDAEDGVVPDFIITDDEGSVRGVVEFKSDPILRPTDNWGVRGNVFANLQDIHVINGTVETGLPMKFVWPYYGEAEGSRADAETVQPSDIQTKLLIQVWTQMVTKNVSYAMLSSYSSNTFFYKSGKRLYMSPTYDTKDLLLMTCCWLMLVLGLVDETEMQLPNGRSDWYTANIDIQKGMRSAETLETVGIVPAAKPLYYLHLIK